MNQIIVAIFIITALAKVNSENQVSPVRAPQHLIILAEMETNIFNILEEYSKVQNNNNRIGLVNEYLEDFKESSLKPTAHLNPSEAAIHISKNPIMAYRMIRRYSKMLQNLHTKVIHKTDSEFLRRITSAKSENDVFVNWPSDGDLKDAMDALLRLHQVYDFDLDEFTSGNLMGTQTHVQLNTIHCQELGEFAVRSKLYYTGILWLEAALRKVEEFPESGNLFEIQKSLRKANEAHDLAWGDRGEWDYNFFSQRLNETVNNKIRKSLRSEAYEKNKGKQIKCNRDVLNFWELCSGRHQQTQEVISKLFCMYDSKSNPAWVINPLKVEQLSLSPFLLQYYDVLGDKTIKSLKAEAFPQLEHHTTFRVNSVTIGSSLTVAHLNTSEVFWRVTRLIELMTGLKHTTPEYLLISSYAYGGHFQPHKDWRKVGRGSEYRNDYSASFMFSLENIEMGGYTAFLHAGIAYRQLKGSAVFWHNLKKNGKSDPTTCHGGCPVVLGHKWTATKRPYTDGQIFARPCGLNKYE